MKPKAGFRLWLTAEVHAKFPPILLQSSLKITYEVSVYRAPLDFNLFSLNDLKSQEVFSDDPSAKCHLTLCVVRLNHSKLCGLHFIVTV